jgi:hypothetical protein
LSDPVTSQERPLDIQASLSPRWPTQAGSRPKIRGERLKLLAPARLHPFNLTQGALATATGIGAGLSNLLAGFVVKAAGFDAGFITLAAIAAAAAIFYAVAMPETRGSLDIVAETPSVHTMAEMTGPEFS